MNNYIVTFSFAVNVSLLYSLSLLLLFLDFPHRGKTKVISILLLVSVLKSLWKGELVTTLNIKHTLDVEQFGNFTQQVVAVFWQTNVPNLMDFITFFSFFP